MFLAQIDSASLKNPTILNGYHHRKVTVTFEAESETSKFHYIFLLEIESHDINKVIAGFQKEMLMGWYSFFWSKKTLYIVFNTRFFRFVLPEGWSSKEYKDAQKFGQSQNIPDIYLDFKKYFRQNSKSP